MMTRADAPIRTLIVDDTRFYRDLIAGLLSEFPDIEVVGKAEDAFDAREKIKQLNPDVVTLDIEMPGMNGLEFLDKIMRLRPMPVVVVSTLTGIGTETAIAAMEIGAVDCVAKPQGESDNAVVAFAEDLSEKIRAAACAVPVARHQPRAPLAAQKRAPRGNAPTLIAIGASTGGVETITEILTQLPDGCPPIAIAQHMPSGFTASFAARLSKICAFPVHEARDGMTMRPGMAVIAPGGLHLELTRYGSSFSTRLTEAPPVNRHRPSVDVLFESAARAAGDRSMGVILTGMGNDGAAGLLRMRQAGAQTIAEDEASCVVYGMPGSAVKCGAVLEVHSLQAIPQVLINRCFA